MTHLRQLPTLTLAAAKAITAAAEAFAPGRGWTVRSRWWTRRAGPAPSRSSTTLSPAVRTSPCTSRRRRRAIKRPTKALEEAVAGGRQRAAQPSGVTAVEGDYRLSSTGRVVGGGRSVSGMQSSQDSQVAEPGARGVPSGVSFTGSAGCHSGAVVFHAIIATNAGGDGPGRTSACRPALRCSRAPGRFPGVAIGRRCAARRRRRTRAPAGWRSGQSRG